MSIIYILIIKNITIIIIITIIIRLKQCNTQILRIEFCMTSQFVDKATNRVTLPAQPCFYFRVNFLTPWSFRNLELLYPR